MTTEKKDQFTRRSLETIYAKYNRFKFIHPDPLEFLFKYDDPEDREIVGLIASSLAYGRVAQILKSVSIVLDKMGSPRNFITSTSTSQVKRIFADFKHRFTTGQEMSAFILGISRMIKRYDSIEGCFLEGYNEKDDTLFKALEQFSHKLLHYSKTSKSSLVPNPTLGSACKRMNLYLRWMVRDDNVDPGGWSAVSTSKLIIPLDTHMHRISIDHGLTTRKNADMKTAQEITAAFAKICPKDPTRYDFALTRPGIRGED